MGFTELKANLLSATEYNELVVVGGETAEAAMAFHRICVPIEEAVSGENPGIILLEEADQGRATHDALVIETPGSPPERARATDTPATVRLGDGGAQSLTRHDYRHTLEMEERVAYALWRRGGWNAIITALVNELYEHMLAKVAEFIQDLRVGNIYQFKGGAIAREYTLADGTTKYNSAMSVALTHTHLQTGITRLQSEKRDNGTTVLNMPKVLAGGNSGLLQQITGSPVTGSDLQLNAWGHLKPIPLPMVTDGTWLVSAGAIKSGLRCVVWRWPELSPIEFDDHADVLKVTPKVEFSLGAYTRLGQVVSKG